MEKREHQCILKRVQVLFQTSFITKIIHSVTSAFQGLLICSRMVMDNIGEDLLDQLPLVKRNESTGIMMDIDAKEEE